MPRLTRLAAIQAGFGVSLACLPVAAQTRTALSVGFEGCSDEAAIRAAFDVELADAEAEVVEAIEESGGTISCGPTSAEIRLVDRETGRFVGQSIERTERGFARRVAIATIELVRVPAVLPGARATAAPRGTSPPPRAGSSPLSLGGSGAGAWLGGDPWLHFGIALRGAVEPSPALAFVLDVEALFGSFDTHLGNVVSLVVTACVSPRFGGAFGPLVLRTGPAVRAGVAGFRGDPFDAAVARGNTHLGPWLGLGAVGEVALRVAHFEAYVELEGGGVPLATAARVDGSIATDLTGAYLEARIGVAWRSE